MSEHNIKIGRLHLTAPSAEVANGLGQQVARNIQRNLPKTLGPRQIDQLHVTVSHTDAHDPASIARAVIQALRGGGS